MSFLLFSVSIKDCEVDAFRAGGKGGQHQNKTSSGIRITHAASGAVGEARDNKSQLTNKRNAWMRMCKSREFQRWHKAETDRRMGRDSIAVKHGSGDSGFGSKRVRNYDFPDREVKDPLTKHTRHDLENVLNGDIDSFILARMRAA